jgi:hypothetical protein
MLPMSTGAVGERTRYVAHVLRRVAGHPWAVTRSYLVRFFTHSWLWEISLGALPTSSGAFPCTSGPLHVVLGTLLHARRLWEVPLGTLPRSSGVLPGSPVLLPGCPRHASRVVQAVTRARLAHFIASTDVGHPRRAEFLAGSGSNEHAGRDNPRGRHAYWNGRAVLRPVRARAGWILPVEPLLHTAARPSIWADALAIVRQRAV